MDKRYLLCLMIFCIRLFSIPEFSFGAEDPVLRIGGLVQSPICLTFSDLQQFKQEEISLCEGVRMASPVRTVALRTLIKLAKPQEPIEELAIVLKSSNREQLALSGAEIAGARTVYRQGPIILRRFAGAERTDSNSVS
jgi:hypothetical protein